MQNMKVALVQADQKWEDKSANFIHYENLLSTVSGVDLILFPEMVHHRPVFLILQNISMHRR